MNLYILLLVAIAAFAFYKLGRYQENVEMRLQALEKQAAELKARQEQPKQKAHSYSTLAGIEDATAVVIDLVEESRALEARLETLRGILGLVRQGPHAYNADRPAGRRLNI